MTTLRPCSRPTFAAHVAWNLSPKRISVPNPRHPRVDGLTSPTLLKIAVKVVMAKALTTHPAARPQTPAPRTTATTENSWALVVAPRSITTWRSYRISRVSISRPGAPSTVIGNAAIMSAVTCPVRPKVGAIKRSGRYSASAIASWMPLNVSSSDLVGASGRLTIPAPSPPSATTPPMSATVEPTATTPKSVASAAERERDC